MSKEEAVDFRMGPEASFRRWRWFKLQLHTCVGGPDHGSDGSHSVARRLPCSDEQTLLRLTIVLSTVPVTPYCVHSEEASIMLCDIVVARLCSYSSHVGYSDDYISLRGICSLLSHLQQHGWLSSRQRWLTLLWHLDALVLSTVPVTPYCVRNDGVCDGGRSTPTSPMFDLAVHI